MRGTISLPMMEVLIENKKSKLNLGILEVSEVRLIVSLISRSAKWSN